MIFISCVENLKVNIIKKVTPSRCIGVCITKSKTSRPYSCKELKNSINISTSITFVILHQYANVEIQFFVSIYLWVLVFKDYRVSHYRGVILAYIRTYIHIYKNSALLWGTCFYRYASESVRLACKFAYRNATPGSTLGGKNWFSVVFFHFPTFIWMTCLTFIKIQNYIGKPSKS